MLEIETDAASHLQEYGYFQATVNDADQVQLPVAEEKLAILMARLRSLLGDGEFRFDHPNLRINYINIDGFNTIELIPTKAFSRVDVPEIGRIGRVLDKERQANKSLSSQSVIFVKNGINSIIRFDINNLIDVYKTSAEIAKIVGDLAPKIGVPVHARMGVVDYQAHKKIVDLASRDGLHRDRLKGFVSLSLNVSAAGAQWQIGPHEKKLRRVEHECGEVIGLNAIADLGFEVDPIHVPKAKSAHRVAALYSLIADQGMNFYRTHDLVKHAPALPQKTRVLPLVDNYSVATRSPCATLLMLRSTPKAPAPQMVKVTERNALI